MKKIFLISMLLTIIILLQKVNIKAEEFVGPDDNTYNYRYNFVTQYYDYYIYSDYPFAYVKQDPSGGWYRLVTVKEIDGELYLGSISTSNGSYHGILNCNYPSNKVSSIEISKKNGDKPDRNMTLAQNPNDIDLELYDTYEEAFQALTYVDPTYYYDSTLDSPEFKIFILELPDFLGLPSEETNYFGIDFPDPDSRYKLDVVYRTILPTDISIGLSNGKITYQPLFYDHSVWTYAYHDYAVSVNNNLDDNDFWWIAPPEPNFTTNMPAWQSNPNAAAYLNAQSSWDDHYKYCLPLYGNRIEICARYYYENGNDVYVGPWTQWVNTYPSTYNDQVPTNYVQGDYLPGIQGVENNESLPENVISSGEVTGPTTTTSITINQAVPNYPDYPTAASYNHDNVLLQWIQTSLRLPSMFGQFGTFLASAFTFIPSSFWTIVGFGLMCCIAIMIVKVL